jgi:hypothetical protein
MYSNPDPNPDLNTEVYALAWQRLNTSTDNWLYSGAVECLTNISVHQLNDTGKADFFTPIAMMTAYNILRNGAGTSTLGTNTRGATSTTTVGTTNVSGAGSTTLGVDTTAFASTDTEGAGRQSSPTKNNILREVVMAFAVKTFRTEPVNANICNQDLQRAVGLAQAALLFADATPHRQVQEWLDYAKAVWASVVRCSFLLTSLTLKGAIVIHDIAGGEGPAYICVIQYHTARVFTLQPLPP